MSESGVVLSRRIVYTHTAEQVTEVEVNRSVRKLRLRSFTSASGRRREFANCESLRTVHLRSFTRYR